MHSLASSHRGRIMPEEAGEVTFVVRSEGHVAMIPRRALLPEVSPVLLALVTERDEEGAVKAEKDSHGRYVLEGPTNAHAFALLVSCVKGGGWLTPAEVAERLPDVESVLEACRYADYYLLPGQAKTQLTRHLFAAFKGSDWGGGQFLDCSKLGLCRSEMILEKLSLDGVCLRNLQLEECHVRNVQLRRCRLADCELALSVTAAEVLIGRSRLENVNLSVFVPKITVEDGSELLSCNLRVVEELHVRESTLTDCSFRGSDEDRKDRQVVSASFLASEIHGDTTLPFNRIVCEQTCFHGEVMRMTKGGASISLSKTRIHSLPSIESQTRVFLCLEDCDLVEALAFRNMRLQLRDVRLSKACDFSDVEFVEKVSDIVFPRKSKFRQVRFKEGLERVVAAGCFFEGCNLGYGQDAVADCLLTQCSFQSCRFPFLEADSPVANLSGGSFVACRIQWSGQFPHEESFVINSYWLRKWNLAGCAVSDGLGGP